MAGNFAVIEREGGVLKVHMIGVIDDLSRAPLQAAAAGLGDQPLFVRLNVARIARREEHQDLVAAYSPREVFEAGL